MAAALRSAIDEMFGQRAHVQRCRTHKLRNVLERLPKTEAAQTKAVMMRFGVERRLRCTGRARHASASRSLAIA